MSLRFRRETRCVIVTPFETDLDYDQLERLLETKFSSNGRDLWIAAIHAPTYDVVRLTGLLSSRGRSDIAARITEIQFTGRMLSRRERRLLSTFWPRPVDDSFSMSELVTGCSYCELCEGYHFDAIAQYEVLDVESARPLTEGRGRLAVTGFYPIHQMTPRIRYLNGDLVDLWRSDCPLGPRVFRPLGRFSRSATVRVASGARYVLAPGEVLDVLDEIPDVARNTIAGLGSPSDSEWGWTPRFQLLFDARAVRVAVELRFEPKAFPERATELSTAIATALRKASPVVEEALAQEALRIDLVGPGNLADAVSDAHDSVRRRRTLLNDPIGI
jgi:hypothetical protein